MPFRLRLLELDLDPCLELSSIVFVFELVTLKGVCRVFGVTGTGTETRSGCGGCSCGCGCDCDCGCGWNDDLGLQLGLEDNWGWLLWLFLGER